MENKFSLIGARLRAIEDTVDKVFDVVIADKDALHVVSNFVLHDVSWIGFEFPRFPMYPLSIFSEEAEQRAVLQVPVKIKKKKKRPGQTVRETLKMAKAGHSLEGIAAVRDLTESTVAQHIETLLADGETLEIDDLIPAETRLLCEELFGRMGGASMRSIIEASGNKVTYADLRVVRAFMQQS